MVSIKNETNLAEREKIFQEFLESYLGRVSAILPDSFRAIQLKNGGIEKAAVYEFETKFLKEPFMKAFSEAMKLGKEENKNLKLEEIKKAVLNLVDIIFEGKEEMIREEERKDIKSRLLLGTDKELEGFVAGIKAQTKQELIRKIEKLKCNQKCKVNKDYHDGHNSALKELLEKLGGGKQ